MEAVLIETERNTGRVCMEFEQYNKRRGQGSERSDETSNWPSRSTVALGQAAEQSSSAQRMGVARSGRERCTESMSCVR